MDLGLTDRVYVVTGGARGLGRATADVLVAEGARVVLSSRGADSLARAAADLGDRVVTVAADNADPATPGRLVSAAHATWGRLDGALVSVGRPATGAGQRRRRRDRRAVDRSVRVGVLRCGAAGA